MDKSSLFVFYRREIFEILSECTHRDELYFDDFENKISGLWAAAFREGIEEIEFKCLLSEALPGREIVFNHIFEKAS